MGARWLWWVRGRASALKHDALSGLPMPVGTALEHSMDARQCGHHKVVAVVSRMVLVAVLVCSGQCYG